MVCVSSCPFSLSYDHTKSNTLGNSFRSDDQMKDLTRYRWRESCNAKEMGGSQDDCTGIVVVYFILRGDPAATEPLIQQDQVYWLCFKHWHHFMATMLSTDREAIRQEGSVNVPRTN